MSEVLMVSEEIVRSLASSVASLQCDVETYKSMYAALLYSAKLVIAKRLVYSRISAQTAYTLACDELRLGIANAEKIQEDNASDVVDDDVDYCTECCEPLSALSARAGRCLNCVP